MSMLAEVFQQVPDPWWLIDLNSSQFLDANQASVDHQKHAQSLRPLPKLLINASRTAYAQLQQFRAVA